jgi:hypothetical protein
MSRYEHTAKSKGLIKKKKKKKEQNYDYTVCHTRALERIEV